MFAASFSRGFDHQLVLVLSRQQEAGDQEAVNERGHQHDDHKENAFPEQISHRMLPAKQASNCRQSDERFCGYVQPVRKRNELTARVQMNAGAWSGKSAQFVLL
jgi:hypothetical protein